jgi:hypothetical protein
MIAEFLSLGEAQLPQEWGILNMEGVSAKCNHLFSNLKKVSIREEMYKNLLSQLKRHPRNFQDKKQSEQNLMRILSTKKTHNPQA